MFLIRSASCVVPFVGLMCPFSNYRSEKCLDIQNYNQLSGRRNSTKLRRFVDTSLGSAVPDVAAVVETLRDRGVKLERFDGFPHEDTGILTTPDPTTQKSLGFVTPMETFYR